MLELTIKKIINRLRRYANNSYDYIKYKFGVTCVVTSEMDDSFFSSTNIDFSDKDLKEHEVVVNFYLEHRFDLLGSGWVNYSHDSKPLGFMGKIYNDNDPLVSALPHSFVSLFHKKKALKIESMISEGYQYIDWHRDIKSGFRWSVKDLYYRPLRSIGLIDAADIKVPWELSRLQHLPQMAILGLGFNSEFQYKIKREFVDQSLDFFASNPVGMGVNWSCPMDVSIRACNMIVAYSLLNKEYPELGFSNHFNRLFYESIYQHGKFIFEHLEYNKVYPQRNNNHYLSNICGLIFCSAYLKNQQLRLLWLDYAQEAFLDCIDKQFYPDGSNFEASTSYHRLSGELVVYPIAVLLNLKGRNWVELFLGQERIEKIKRMGDFTKVIQNSNGNVPQIGDNDSGRLFRIDLCGELLTCNEAINKYINLDGYSQAHKLDEHYWDQNCLDHTSFASAVDALFGKESKLSYEAHLLLSLSGGITLTHNYSSDTLVNAKALPKISTTKNDIVLDKFLLSDPLVDLSVQYFPYFGLTVLACGSHFYCSIYTGGVGQAGNGGHAHADFGSYELTIGHELICRDPGTFVYTPSKFWRNYFRIEAHNGMSKSDYVFNSLFSADFPHEKCGVKHFSDGVQVNFGNRTRKFIVTDNEFIVMSNDVSFKKPTKSEFYSNGYGRLIRE